MKTNKQYLPILILLIGLSGCGKKKKNNLKNNSSKKQSVMLNIPVAQDTITVANDESIRNFFDQDIEQFVSCAKEDTKNTTASQKTMPNDAKDFAWINNSASNNQEFKAIYFDFDEHSIRKDQEKVAANNVANAHIILAEAQKNGTKPTFIIEGHTCHSAGSATYNLPLSENRAKVAADWFAKQNILQENIKIVGRGFEVPAIINGKAVEGDRAQQWANRRVEVHVLYS